jgi:voltage-gated potassium channel
MRIDRVRLLWLDLRAEGVPRLAFYFAFMLVIGGYVVYVVERSQNPAFGSLGDGLWWSLVTLTTIGYGDKYPITTAGRVLASMVVMFGIGMVGIVTGKIASALVERRIKEGRGLSQARGLSSHFVILGWKTDLHQMLADMLAAHPDLKAERLVLVNAAGEAVNEDLRERFRGLVYIHGDVIDPLALQRAAIERAAKVFVLADSTGERSEQEIDARTVMALMNIENIAPNVYTCAEVLDMRYAEYLQLAHCDEIIPSREYGRYMLVSASVSSGITQALLHIIDITNTGGLVSAALPPGYVGRSYADLSAHFKADGGRLLVGLIENTGQALAIKRDALREAQKTADISRLLENLKNVKEMVSNRTVINPGDDYSVPAHARALVLRRGAGA